MSNIAPWVHRKIIVLHEHEPCSSAAKAMEVHGIGCVMVTDSYGHMTGILTDRDLACRIVGKVKPSETSLLEVMTRDPACVRETDDIEKVCSLMERFGVRRIPVIRHISGGREKCIGLVSLDDLVVNHKIDELTLRRVVSAQILRRVRAARRLERRDEDLKLWALEETMRLATDLPEEKSSLLLRLVLTTFVERLHHSAALRIIGLLPVELQAELLALPPGPDRGYHGIHLIAQVKQELDLDQEEAERAVHHVCRALEEWFGFDAFHHVKDQLPGDIRHFFLPPGAGSGLRVSLQPESDATRASRS